VALFLASSFLAAAWSLLNGSLLAPSSPARRSSAILGHSDRHRAPPISSPPSPLPRPHRRRWGHCRCASLAWVPVQPCHLEVQRQGAHWRHHHNSSITSCQSVGEPWVAAPLESSVVGPSISRRARRRRSALLGSPLVCNRRRFLHGP
jgi:hypothetical protein